ncbi:hypothetical protein KBD08_02810 [Candidatus Babeliales bacterium]|nr:hypothetical protein [Candidatus Babeliales bacterium]
MFSRNLSVFLCLMLAGTVQVCADLDPVRAKSFKVVRSGNRKQVNMSLKKCSNLDISNLNDDNKTDLDPVHAKLFKVVQSGNRKQMNILLKKCSKLDINKLNDDNKTVLDIATECRHIKIAADLLKYGAKVTTNQNVGRLKSLLGKRALMFFVFGLIFTPFLWIGSIIALNNQSQIEVI